MIAKAIAGLVTIAGIFAINFANGNMTIWMVMWGLYYKNFTDS
jgi:hypothetical protein